MCNRGKVSSPRSRADVTLIQRCIVSPPRGVIGERRASAHMLSVLLGKQTSRGAIVRSYRVLAVLVCMHLRITDKLRVSCCRWFAVN